MWTRFCGRCGLHAVNRNGARNLIMYRERALFSKDRDYVPQSSSNFYFKKRIFQFSVGEMLFRSDSCISPEKEMWYMLPKVNKVRWLVFTLWTAIEREIWICTVKELYSRMIGIMYRNRALYCIFKEQIFKFSVGERRFWYDSCISPEKELLNKLSYVYQLLCCRVSARSFR